MADASVTTPIKYARQARWREKNPMKRWAHVATASAVRRGLIQQQPCEVCGSPTSEAHHDDYERPMAVRWFCRLHHKAEHRRQKAEGVR